MIFQSPILNWLVLGLVFGGLPALLAAALAVSRLARAKTGCLPLVLFVVIALAAAKGVTSYLDSAGNEVIGELLSKQELLVHHPDGSWDHGLTATVRYRPSDGSPAIDSILSVPPARFDEMHQGDFPRLRTSESRGFYRFTRLEDQHTWSLLWAKIGSQPFFVVAGLALFLVLGVKLMFRVRLATLFFLIGVAMVGAWWVADVGMPLWSQASLRMNAGNTVNGVVREIHQPYMGTGLRSWISNHIFASYQLVLLDLTPLGREDRVLSVDVVDRGSIALKRGDTLPVDYTPSDPRTCLLRDGQRSYIWKNALLNSLLALIALAFVVAVSLFLREQPIRLPTTSGDRNKRHVRI